MNGLTVTRVGTQVVVRLAGQVDDSRQAQLDAALVEISGLVLHRVVVDCSATTSITGAGLTFLLDTQTRWQMRLLDPPPGLRQLLTGRLTG